MILLKSIQTKGVKWKLRIINTIESAQLVRFSKISKTS